MSKTNMKTRALALSMVTAAVAGCASMAPSLPPAPPQVIVDGERVFPESMASAADGSLYFGSIGNKMIYRAAPGSDKAVAFVQPGTEGLQATFGVFADSKSGTLYACSNNFGGPPGGAPMPANVYAFDLKTGAFKGHYPFAVPGSFCNDMATTPDGTLYATDTNNMQVEVLKKGASSLTIWAGTDGSLGKKGGVIDGISVLGHRIVVNELAVSKLYSIDIGADGTAATPVEITLDRPISRPDGMRSFGKSAVLIVEGGDGGKLEKITFDGNNGKVELIKQGYPDGPVAVAVVGTTAYVCESQMSAMGGRGRPGAAPAPPPVLKPFKATAVEVGKP
jgi:sugar lactone lactonase YvrE